MITITPHMQGKRSTRLRGKSSKISPNNTPANNYNFETPLKAKQGTPTQLAFKGVSLNTARNLMEEIPVNKLLKDIKEVLPSNYRALPSLEADIKNYALENHPVTVIKSIPKSFADAVLDPFRALWNLFKRLTGGEEIKRTLDRENAIRKTENHLTGLYLEVDKYKRAYAKEVEKEGEEAIGELGSYVRKAYAKKIDKKTNTAKSTASSAGIKFVNRSISGTTTGVIVASDFYNLSMLTSDDPEKAKKAGKDRFKQQMSRIGLTMYIGYLLDATFMRLTNAHLMAAVGFGILESITSNTLSRLIHKMPILPQTPKEAKKEPYVINAQGIKQPAASPLSTYKGLKEKNNISFSGNPAGIAKMFAAKMPLEEFSTKYRYLAELCDDSASQTLKNVGKAMGLGEEVTLETIENAARNRGNQVTIGKNLLHRTGKAIIDAVVFPVKILVDLANYTSKKFFNKELIDSSNKNKDYVHQVRNFLNWAEKAKKEAPLGDIEKAKIIFDTPFKEIHNPKVTDYPNTTLSNAMKLTGLVTVPFLAVDAYNQTIKSTNNKNIAQEKARQRAIQDTTRQAVSFWAVKSFNDVFKGLVNSSLLGSGVGVFLNVLGYETLTRLAVGQPVLPKTHEQMKEAEKQRLQKQNWFTKAIGGKIKTSDNTVIVGSSKLKPAATDLNDKFSKFYENLNKQS